MVRLKRPSPEILRYRSDVVQVIQRHVKQCTTAKSLLWAIVQEDDNVRQLLYSTAGKLMMSRQPLCSALRHGRLVHGLTAGLVGPTSHEANPATAEMCMRTALTHRSLRVLATGNRDLTYVSGLNSNKSSSCLKGAGERFQPVQQQPTRLAGGKHHRTTVLDR